MGQDTITGQTVLQQLFYIRSFNACSTVMTCYHTWFSCTDRQTAQLKTSFTLLIPAWQVTVYEAPQVLLPEGCAHEEPGTVNTTQSAIAWYLLSRSSQQNNPNKNWWELVLLANLNPFENTSLNIPAPICVYLFWGNDLLWFGRGY